MRCWVSSLHAQQLPCQPRLRAVGGANSRSQRHVCPAMQETAHVCFPLPREGSAKPQQEEPLLFRLLPPGSLQCLVLATNVRAALWAQSCWASPLSFSVRPLALGRGH